MTVSEQTMRWLHFVGLTSVPLYKLDEKELPCTVASGCFANIGGRKLILSVSHATGEGHWVAEMRFDPEQQRTLVHHFGDVWSVVHLDQNTSMREELDISFTEVPADFFSMMQERNSTGGIIAERPRHEFETTLQDVPDASEIYAFAGRVGTARLDETTFWSGPTVYPGLKYLRTDGHYHVFKLPVPHPGHDAFKGCSGAPIVDRKGVVVALVCSGDIAAATITGVSVQRIGVAVRSYLASGVNA